jgi:RNA polymerase sigma factor (sigma-70 family)
VNAKGDSGGAKRLGGIAGVALRCQPDARLTALSRDGYGEAFEEIARRYGPALTAFAGSIVPAHRAEDVVQEALVKAHRSLPGTDPNLNLRPWLYTIARNTALNDLRNERSHERLDENWDGVPQPPEVAARRAELAFLFERIKDLPPQQREALVKRELEGRGHDEIASILGSTPGAVRGLIFRARAALRDGLGLLIPTPLVRALLAGAPWQSEAVGTGIGGAAAGLTAGGAAMKAGGALVAGVIAVGSGIALHEGGDAHHPRHARGGESIAHSPSAAKADKLSVARSGAGLSLSADTSGRDPRGRSGPGSGAIEDAIPDGISPGAESGSGGSGSGTISSGEHGGDGSGSGSGTSAEGHSGPGGGSGDDDGSSTGTRSGPSGGGSGSSGGGSGPSDADSTSGSGGGVSGSSGSGGGGSTGSAGGSGSGSASSGEIAMSAETTDSTTSHEGPDSVSPSD